MYIDTSTLIMRFRSLVDLVPFLPLILAQTGGPSPNGHGGGNSNSRCRCIYGSSCWPSEQEFTTLSSGLSQPLIRPVPPASACYPPSNPSGNCSIATTLWRDSLWRADQPGAYENTNFETYMFKNGSVSGCYINTTLGLPCEQGSVPPIGVDARTTEDVQAAVKFAARHNLRLVVKNTGHDYLGRSAGRGAFMIWTHHLKNTTYDANFIPEGGSSSDATPAITLGAGVQWGEAYNAAAASNRFLVGGLSTGMSVGASGGWIQGGGHSAFAPAYGLGVDNAIQFTLISATGSLLTASPHTNPDLFWALRGGGAGSWGVILSVTYKAHELLPLVMTGLNITIPDPETMALPIVTEFIKLHPTLSDKGWGGYSGFSNTSLMAFWVAPNVSWAEANATIQPFFDLVRNVTQNPNVTTFSFPFNDFNGWLNATFGSISLSGSQVGGNVELSSRLMAREAASGERAEDTARRLLEMGNVAINAICGGAVSRADPSSTGLNPGWRDAVGLVYTTGFWQEGASPEVIQAVRQQLVSDIHHLDPISPDSATYMNEASLYEPDFKKAFFGSHYNQLRQIKQKYDPKSLFIVAEGVGSEDWNGDLTCRH
ncbi:hypothetical protein D9756_008853 [Leucocoprinus leucothites]|uniref:FAD-binding PCMH-type domain-containing protein n=1 Tax=Leucocoprinus leucothites TaxID=201217 RepID=A0A8H5CX88_9AGAR|nr:hypothetical protein D9756_008853 [Leucoagaricus leucothites]